MSGIVNANGICLVILLESRKKKRVKAQPRVQARSNGLLVPSTLSPLVANYQKANLQKHLMPHAHKKKGAMAFAQARS